LRPAVRSREGRHSFCTIQLCCTSIFDRGGSNPSFADIEKITHFWKLGRGSAMHRSGNTLYTIRSFTLSAEQCWYRLAPFSKPVAQIQVLRTWKKFWRFENLGRENATHRSDKALHATGAFNLSAEQDCYHISLFLTAMAQFQVLRTWRKSRILGNMVTECDVSIR
jgi:hypothetical protein